MTVLCGSCGHPNDDDALFCASCNHFLAWSGQLGKTAPAPPAAPPPEAPAAPPPEAPAAPPTPTPAPAPTAPTRTPAPAQPETAEGRALPPTGRKAPPAPPASPAPLAAALTAAAQLRPLAEQHGRADLLERLDGVTRRLRSREVTVAVVGEFKRGKSTVVNALIQRAVCPVDADIVTGVPTLIRYGEEPSVTAYELIAGTTEPVGRSVPFTELSRIVSDTGEHGGDKVQSVEVQVPHRILRTGLRLLDTPGVGGLDSAHGQLTLGSLTGVDGILFVTDASQELTAPELDFLRQALQRCATAALVVTKTDLHLQWRRIVDLDRRHLADAGLPLPVIPVSSFLRLRAADRPSLNAESGYAALVEFLAKGVVRPADTRAAAAAAHEVDFVAEQLTKQTDAERVVLARPASAPQVVERLTAANGRARALSAPSAGWQQLLSDGMQDLRTDVEHDLQARLRSVLTDVREMIDRSDPRTTWTDTGAWLRRQVAAAAVANRDLLVQRAGELTDAVAAEFAEASGDAVEVPLDLMARSLREMKLPSASSFSMPGGRLASLIVTVRTTALVPMLAVSLASFLAIPPLALVGGAVVATTGVGAKLFRDEGRRQREYRRQQAKGAAAKFVEEAAFEMNKETRDAVTRTQRRLRDEFQLRARMLQASATGALQAAERSSTLDPDGQRRRSRQLDEENTRLGAVRLRMSELSAGPRDG